VRRVTEVLGEPFIGRGMELSGWEAGGQVAASGAPSNRWLLEGEATRRPFDEGEMKMVAQHFGSASTGRGRAASDGVWRGGTLGRRRRHGSGAQGVRQPQVG
jgi:hypothetical protein